MIILGISCFYHDAAAAVVRDGKLIAAAQEERFTRKKHDQDFPNHAIEYCLREANVAAKEIDYVAFYDKPLLKFERILITYLATFPRSLPSFLKAMPVWLKEKLWVPQLIRSKLGYTGPILFAEHHISHAASAFLVSPFSEAAILTIDGVGEWDTATIGIGEDRTITILRSLQFPHSLGLLYSAFTYYLGFKVNSDEYKVMGLAPYGKPIYSDAILNHLVSLKDDGSFKLNMRYFAYDYGLTMTNRHFHELFGAAPRQPESRLTQFHKDIAASIQFVTNEIVVRMAQYLYDQTHIRNLAMAGGVALNCVANSEVKRRVPFKEIFIQPAASDAGGAVGAAYYVYNMVLGHERNFVFRSASLGPQFSDDEIESYLRRLGVPFRKLNRENLISETAKKIAEQRVIGWFQGRMEFGPRALGNRSIIADARNPENHSRVNLKIKFRESFRPFAPTILEERTAEFFHWDQPSPYMLFVATARDRTALPAVTHVDGSARLQTLRRDENPLFYDLLKEFERRTGCPAIINTSFNVRGEPIVCTPQDAFRCFMRTNMDDLVMGSFIVEKEQLNGILIAETWQQIPEQPISV
ncbi:MAG: carbamoyltransferase family protein [Bacteroidota bacterium]